MKSSPAITSARPFVGAIGSKTRVLAGAAAILAAVALRTWNLAERPTWYDELGSYYFALIDVPRLLVATAADTMPPLYYLLLKGALLARNDLVGARLLSVFFGLVVVGLALALARLTVDGKTTVVTVILIALNPFLVYHAQEARMYSLLAASQTGAVIALLLALSRGGRWWVAFGLAELVGFWTHNAAFLHLLATDLLLVALLASARCRKAFWPCASRVPEWRGILVSHLVLALGFAPWLFVVPAQLEKVTRAFWIERSGPSELLRSHVVFLFNLPPATSWLLWPLVWLTVLCLALIGWIAFRNRSGELANVGRLDIELGEPSRARLHLLAWFWLVPIVVALLVSQVRPVFVERVLISSTIPFLLILASTLVRLRPIPVAVGLTALLCALGVVGSVAQSSHAGFPRAPWPDIVRYLRETSPTGTVIVHDNKLTYFPTRYAAPDLPQAFLSDPAWSASDTFAPASQQALGMVATPIDSIAPARSVTFIIFRQAIEEAPAQGRRPENLEWLRERFTEQAEIAFGDVRVLRFEKPS